MPLIPATRISFDGWKRKRWSTLELGVGGNTCVIIKYPFWKMTYQNAKAFYASTYLNPAVPRKFQTVNLPKQRYWHRFA